MSALQTYATLLGNIWMPYEKDDSHARRSYEFALMIMKSKLRDKNGRDGD